MLSCISKIFAQKRVSDPNLKSLQISIVTFSGSLSKELRKIKKARLLSLCYHYNNKSDAIFLVMSEGNFYIFSRRINIFFMESVISHRRGKLEVF